MRIAMRTPDSRITRLSRSMPNTGVFFGLVRWRSTSTSNAATISNPPPRTPVAQQGGAEVSTPINHRLQPVPPGPVILDNWATS